MVGTHDGNFQLSNIVLSKVEKELMVKLYQYPLVIAEAGKDMSPGVLCNYIYELAKIFSLFYHDHTIMKEENTNQKGFRIAACKLTANVIKSGFALLGIQVPEKM
jgi:arginyl-tRNA synthetase